MFTALGHWLTTKITEVIGSRTVVFLGTRAENTLTGFREMPRAGYLEARGPEWGAGRRRNITSPRVDIKGASEEELNAAGPSKFRRGVDKMQFIFPRRPDAIFASKGCSKEVGESHTDEQKLERLVKWLHNNRQWSFRQDPDPKSQHILEGWTDTDWAGCKETRQSIACGLIVWPSVVLSSYWRTLTKEMGLSSPETEYYGICSVGVELMYLGELLATLRYCTRLGLR